jgi:hypothetical protein
MAAFENLFAHDRSLIQAIKPFARFGQCKARAQTFLRK